MCSVGPYMLIEAGGMWAISTEKLEIVCWPQGNQWATWALVVTMGNNCSLSQACILELVIRSPLGKSGPGKLWSLEKERETTEKQKRKMGRGRNWAIMATSTIKEVMEPAYSPGVFWDKYEGCGFPPKTQFGPQRQGRMQWPQSPRS